MFGYIRPEQSELRVRENEYYKAIYCGLCHSMRRLCGPSFCGTLSYDFVFLAIARMAILGVKPEFVKKRCMAHPLRKRNAAADNDVLRYSAGAAALLSYGKCRDDVSDERGFKKLRARLALPFFAHARKRALRRLPELSALDLSVGQWLSRLAEAEKSHYAVASADATAEIFGKLLGEILAFGLDGADATVARSLGESVGHWIFLIDAADDFSDDVRLSRPNPLASLYGSDLSDGVRGEIGFALTAKLTDAEKAIDLIDFCGYAESREIIRNVLYLGMPAAAKKVLFPESKNDRNDRQTKKKGIRQ